VLDGVNQESLAGIQFEHALLSPQIIGSRQKDSPADGG
jgi:hypothetical protein